MLNFLQNLFTPKVNTKSEFAITEHAQQEVVNTNRASLMLVRDWIDEKAFSSSCFEYGVPPFIRTEINKPIGEQLTYTDLMLHISRTHFSKLNYLEIGVSVGKNFFQMVNAHSDAGFTGFDIEEINPVLESYFEKVSQDSWNTPAKSIKKNQSSIKKYTHGSSQVAYMSADVWDENSWARLSGQKFNMVFSDALHTPKAILFEFEMLVKYDLLDEKFVIVWDDLVGKMKNSFFKIIKKYDRKYQIESIYLMSINGWVGQHEPAHTVGLISNFQL